MIFRRWLIVLASLLWMACTSSEDDTKLSSLEPIDPSQDVLAPIVVVGHGVFIDTAGDAVEPDLALIRATQRRTIEQLEALEVFANTRVPSRDIIDRLVPDDVLAGALYVDTLLEALKPPDHGRLAAVNNALRWQYWLELLREDPPQPGQAWTKGIDEQTATELEARGITVLLSIDAGGAEYRRACVAAGVPVPEAMYSSEWVNWGTFDEFLSDQIAELWSFQSSSPPGVCLALPRYFDDDPTRAKLFGVICLGTLSSKACFFDNPAGTFFTRNAVEPFSSWLGGTDLVANNQGECTDCHAGENPFVVHPEKQAFQDLLSAVSLQPLSWHEPLVDATWVQNPGPTTLLSGVSST